MEDIHDYVSFVICILTLIANVILNVGIITAAYIDRTLRQKRFAILISLAVADLLKAIPLISELRSSSDHFTTCLIFASVGLYLICVTILHLVLESINRLIAIARPLRYNDLLSTRLFVSLMAVVWLLPVLGIILPHFIYIEEVDWIPSFRVLMFNCDSFANNMTRRSLNASGKHRPIPTKPVGASFVTYSAFITVIYFLIPLIMMILSYSIIFNISLKHIRQIKSMEKNMRQLYHRISKSKLISAQGSDGRGSTTSSAATTESFFLPPVAGVVSQDGSAYENTLQNRTNVKRYKDLINDTTDQSPNGRLPETDGDISGERRRPRSAEAVERGHGAVSGDSAGGVKTQKVSYRRKLSNVVYPNNTNFETYDSNTLPVNVDRNSSALPNANDAKKKVVTTEQLGEFASYNLDNSSKGMQSIVPVRAEDVMKREFENVASDSIWYIDQRESEAAAMNQAKDEYAPIYPSSSNEICSRNGGGISNVQHQDASDEVFLEDIDDKTNGNVMRMKQANSLLMNQRLPESTKQHAWPKLWRKAVKRGEDGDKIPSEAAFIEIIEHLETKSRQAPKRFEESARRVMRFSVLLRSHRRGSSLYDEEADERPTQEEVDHMESLLCIAESRPVEQMARELSHSIDGSQPQSKEAKTVDLLSLATGFPVMEAWADSLKAKAVPQSNSFVRFYRVIRGEMRNRKKEGKLVKTLGILFTTWILFYVPILAFSWQRLRSWPVSANNDHGTSKVLISWALLSSAFNPMIYCLRIPEFKMTFNKIYLTIKSYLCCN